MRVLSLAKKPGTAYARRVNFVSGGALSDDHPARKAGLTEDGIMGYPLDELEDEEVTMDPTRTQVYREEDMHNWLNVQHDQGFRVGHPDTERRPTWPTRREMTLDDYRRLNGPEPAEFGAGIIDVLRNNGVPEEDWETWVGTFMPRFQIETADELEEFLQRPMIRLSHGLQSREPPRTAGDILANDYGVNVERSASPSLASVATQDTREATREQVYDMLEYYTNRMDNAAITGDRMELDHAYMQADSTLEEDLAHIAEDHHREYLRRFYEDAVARLPRRSGRIRGRQEEDEDFDPNRTRQRFS